MFKERSFNDFSGWQLRLPGNHGIPTPAVHDGRIYVGGGFGSHDFYAVDAVTGAMLWHRRTKDDGPTAAVVAGGLAVFNTESCTLEAVHARSGEVCWSHWLGDPLLAQPATDGLRVYMAYPGKGGHVLGAFRLSDGQPLWTAAIDHDVITAPVASDGVVYLSTFEGAVWALRAEDGHVLWRRNMQATSAPWVVAGEVYVAHKAAHGTEPGADATGRRGPARGAADTSERTGRLKSSDGRPDRAYSAKKAHYLHRNWGADAKRRAHAEDAAVGFAHAPASAGVDRIVELIGEEMISRAWRYQGSRPVVVGGVLYDTTGDRLEARDAGNDAVIWSWCDAEAVSGERRLTPPAVTNGRVYAGTFDGRIMSWNAWDGSLRWQVATGAPCHWQPVIDHGRVFAGLENGTLIAFATGDSLDTGWPCWGGGPGHNGGGCGGTGRRSHLGAAPLDKVAGDE